MANKKKSWRERAKLSPLSKEERDRAVEVAVALNKTLAVVKSDKRELVEWLREIAEYHRIEGAYPGTVFTVCHVAADQLEK